MVHQHYHTQSVPLPVGAGTRLPHRTSLKEPHELIKKLLDFLHLNLNGCFSRIFLSDRINLSPKTCNLIDVVHLCYLKKRERKEKESMDPGLEGCLKVFTLAPIQILNFLCSISVKKIRAFHTSRYMKFTNFEATLLLNGLVLMIRNVSISGPLELLILALVLCKCRSCPLTALQGFTRQDQLLQPLLTRHFAILGTSVVQ